MSVRGKVVRFKTALDRKKTGIVLSERLKETFDEEGYGGCFQPQVLVAWTGLEKQQWVPRSRLSFGYERTDGTFFFT